MGRGAKQLREDAKTWQNGEDDGRVVSAQPRVADKRDLQAPPTGPYIAHITNNAREREMERNMQQVHMMVGNLRNMAIDMGSEIESQNAQLDRINLKANTGLRRMENNAERMRRLL
ncbi:SNAP25 [Cordylochernes scorpioides]|uniref:Synaptosomal-associated protein n=1 Tax=Cordylochernes scorpioides TaxID=51811 RepID=A0ABY6L0B9_9ARAC|nr:SNAP25 [Cordylochernes scorpioides]